MGNTFNNAIIIMFVICAISMLIIKSIDIYYGEFDNDTLCIVFLAWSASVFALNGLKRQNKH